MSKIPFLDPDFEFEKMQDSSNQKLLAKWYFDLDISIYNKLLFAKPTRYWQQMGEDKALKLLKLASLHIPAYKDFLDKQGIKVGKINSIHDFKQIPPTDKKNYISQYSMADLSWNGKFDKSNIISLSSGSSGTPFFWPRGSYQSFEGAFQFEHLLTSLFDIHQKSTLLVDCFSMGSYVAGVYVFTCIKLLALKGYRLTVVTPGLNYQEIYRMLKKLAGNYDQIILCGYPPFLKDVLDLSKEFKFNFKKFDIKLLLASEFFSESWREQVLSYIGKSKVINSSTNIYGTADSAIFSFETTISILIRKLIAEIPTAGRYLFQSDLTPTITQYNPLMTYYESVEGELTLTTNAGLPLIRYNLKDKGATLSLDSIEKILSEHSINLKSYTKRSQFVIKPNNLPFVYLTSRTDGAVSFYAILIYPEYVSGGLETEALRTKLSGRFSLFIKNDKKQNPKLFVHVEMNKGVSSSVKLVTTVTSSVINNLKIRCLEYSFLEKSIGPMALPKIVLHKKGESEYFELGAKQKWIAD